MAGRTTPGPGKPLPPRLRRLMDPGEHRLSDQVALELSPREVSALRDVVVERASRPADVSLSRAISSLAARDRSPETAAALSRFAADRREAPVDRAVAAASLRLIPGPEARAGLVRSLKSTEPIVRVEAIKSLGCIGDAATLKALNAVGRGANAGEDRQLDFARALIAHRLGLESDHVPFQHGVARRAGPKEELIPLSLRPVRPRTISVERERLHGSDYGIPLSEKVGFDLHAGKARWAVLVNADITEGGGVFARSSRIFERPWITALLARQDERTKTSAVQYVVLSDPADDGARIMVVRTDGEPVYSGELKQPRGLLSFVVRDIARRGTAPTNVKGHLTTRGVEFEVSIPFGRRKDPSGGEAVVVPR
jgi:hypothetical protein